jgi:hypothetical protein
MLTHLPLDDELNQRFYFEDGIRRLVWVNALGRCALRREAVHVELGEALSMIRRGELLWAPTDSFQPLRADTPPDAVQREHALINAFLRSPAGQRITRWTTRRRLERRLRDTRDWLTIHQLARGDADATGDV